MRTILPEKLEAGRVRFGLYKSSPGSTYGKFHVLGPCGAELCIVASGADPDDEISEGWEHVSISHKKRLPNWLEMCFVKDLFWEPQECVIQFHPPRSEYVNNHPNCLHLWRPTDNHIRLPPSILVGRKDFGELTLDQVRQLRREMHES